MHLSRSILLLFFSLLTACGTHDDTRHLAAGEMATTKSAPALPTPSDAPLPPSLSQSMEQYTDPFAYCAAVQTIDAVDERFVGDPKPQAIIEGLHHAVGGQDDPAEWLAEMTYWRCMEGKVYACSIGANLPCNEKANTSSLPTEAMQEFCRNNPQYEVVKAKNSIYTWTCVNGSLQRGHQWTDADVAGFLAAIWYEIKAPEER